MLGLVPLFLAMALQATGQDAPPQFVRIVPRAVTDTSAVLKQDIAPDIQSCQIPDNQKFTAEIRVTVTPAGLPDHVTLLKTTANDCLDQAALTAVHAATFYPATHDDKPVSQALIELVDLVHYDDTHRSSPTSTVKVTPPRATRIPQLEAHNCRQKSGEEAKALVSIVVDVHGQPQRPSVVTSSGNACIDAVAIRAARGYLFVPAMQEGQPVEFTMKLEMQFNQL
jgi:TonB family protein